MEPTEELAKLFYFWSAILTLKVLAMSILTARQRMAKKIFANPEDIMPSKSESAKKMKVAFDDPDVERVRRAHRNDLENILPWFMITYIWLGTNPSYLVGSLLIRAFVLARVAHTVVYAIVPLQPWRALTFFVGFAVTAYQAISTLIHYITKSTMPKISRYHV